MVKLLTTTINEVIEKAVVQSILQFRQDMLSQTSRISEMEHHMSAVENNDTYSHANIHKTKKLGKGLMEKVEDLENRSQCNNLYFMGHPEIVAVRTLLDICSTAIPQALGLQQKCVVERAHLIGLPNP